MSEAKHTPGPSREEIVRSDAEIERVLEWCINAVDGQQALLEACRRGLEDCNWQVNNHKHLSFEAINTLGDVLEAAIAKAEGKETSNE